MAQPDLNPAELLEAQLARWADPQTHADAEARAARVVPPADRLKAGYKAMQRASSMSARIYWLRDMSKAFGDSVAPHAACKPHCAACCYQPVMVTLAEAKEIARGAHLKLTIPAYRGDQPASEFVGVRCTFLGPDDNCTIYEHRPLACMHLYNMDRDDLLCHVQGEGHIQVPYANATALHQAYVDAHLVGIKPTNVAEAARALRWADLREFFPRGRE